MIPHYYIDLLHLVRADLYWKFSSMSEDGSDINRFSKQEMGSQPSALLEICEF